MCMCNFVHWLFCGMDVQFVHPSLILESKCRHAFSHQNFKPIPHISAKFFVQNYMHFNDSEINRKQVIGSVSRAHHVVLLSGQDNYYRSGLTRPFYNQSDAAVLMFDISDRMSLIRAIEWKKHLDTVCELPNGDPIPCLLLANKVRVICKPVIFAISKLRLA